MQVPRYDSPQVSLNPLPGARVNVDAPIGAFGGFQARATAGLAQGFEAVAGAAQAFAERQARETREANALRLIDAQTQSLALRQQQTFGDAGYANIKGDAALNPGDGLSLADTRRDQLGEGYAKIEEGLGDNPWLRERYRAWANKDLVDFHGEVSRHVDREYQGFKKSTLQGAIDNARNETGLYWNDPKKASDSSLKIRAAVHELGRLTGQSPQWVEAESRQQTSQAHMGALSAALEAGATGYAAEYLHRFGPEMEAGDLLKARSVLDKADRQRTALTVASDVMRQAAPKMDGGDGERLWNLLTGQESGGRQFRADGSVVTSLKGATGIAQVMPATGPEAAKLAGLDWDPQRFKTDAKYNEALGRAYFNKQLRTHGGDVAKALAAYNGGPGRLEKALKQAEADGSPWIGHMPKETRDYVRSILTQYRAGMGAQEPPSLEALQNQALAKLGRNADPEAVKDTLQEISRQYEVHQKATKADRDRAESDAYRQLFANGGDLTALSPALLSRIPGDKLDSMRNFAQKLAKGEDVETDWSRYADLTSEAAQSPDTFAQRDLTLEAPRLARAELKQLIDRQAKIKGGEENQYHVASEEGQIAAIASELKLSKAQRGQFTAAALRELQAATARNGGKRVSPDEERKILDRLVMRGEVPGGAWWKNDREGRAFEFSGTPDAGKFVPDIPDTDRTRIESALRGAGYPVTDANVSAYFMRERGL
jgi:soluble lytic murein transglycosylase